MRYHARGILKNPAGKEIGRIGLSVKARTKKAARALLHRIAKRHFKNIIAGGYDSQGRFHPIRSSKDYDPSRVKGEKRSVRHGKRPQRTGRTWEEIYD